MRASIRNKINELRDHVNETMSLRTTAMKIGLLNREIQSLLDHDAVPEKYKRRLERAHVETWAITTDINLVIKNRYDEEQDLDRHIDDLLEGERELWASFSLENPLALEGVTDE